MKAGNTYKREQAFALLLIGEPKSGKTTAALCFPKPFVLDLDNNLAGAIRHHGDDFDMNELYFEDLEGVEQDKRWSAGVLAIKEACASPDVETIIIDGLSIMAELLMRHILANTKRDSSNSKLIIAGEDCMQMNQWTPFKNLMSGIIMACKSSGKRLVFLCHEAPLTDKNGAVLSYRPMIPGSLKNNIAGYFTDVWRCESGVKAQKPFYRIRFAPKSMMQIGNSLGIKDIDFDITGKTKTEVWNYLKPHFTK